MCLLYVCCNDMGMHMLSIGNATLDFTLKEWEEDQRPGGANQLLRIFEGRAHKPHASRKSTTHDRGHDHCYYHYYYYYYCYYCYYCYYSSTNLLIFQSATTSTATTTPATATLATSAVVRQQV